MIRPRYTFKLALIRFKSKKILLFSSIAIASLLFAILITLTILFTGAENSAQSLVKKIGNNQYLVKVSPVIPFDKVAIGGDLSLEDIREIKSFEKKYYDKLKIEYKSLGLEYDTNTEISALEPASWMSDSVPDELRVTINRSSPVVSSFEEKKTEQYARNAINTFEDLKRIGDRYGAEGYYSQRPSGLEPIPNTRLILDNKENFGATIKSGDQSQYGYYINSIQNSTYGIEDERLLDRFILPQRNTPLKGIPVVASAQELVSLFGKNLGIDEEPDDAKAKVEWLQQVQSKFNGYTYTSCYRNSAEQALLSKIQRDYVVSKDDSNDTTPSHILYDYPKEPCGSITIKSDSRTIAEKELDSEQELIQKKLGTYVKPSHQLLKFQIVGVVNAQPHESSSKSIESYISNLVSPHSDRMSATIPLQLYESLPPHLKLNVGKDVYGTVDAYSLELNEQFYTRILQFDSIVNAKKFMENETCPASELKCNKSFLADPYGSNYLILDDIGAIFAKFASIAFPAVLLLAIVVIWFTMSRTVAEHRKEVAIYRSMGAKRSDILAIYGAYLSLFAALVALAALVLGAAAAYLIDAIYGARLTTSVASTFGLIDKAPKFSLFNLNSPFLIVVIVAIFAACIIASAYPLIRNVLRPPIRDIRED